MIIQVTLIIYRPEAREIWLNITSSPEGSPSNMSSINSSSGVYMTYISRTPTLYKLDVQIAVEVWHFRKDNSHRWSTSFTGEQRDRMVIRWLRWREGTKRQRPTRKQRPRRNRRSRRKQRPRRNQRSRRKTTTNKKTTTKKEFWRCFQSAQHWFPVPCCLLS